MRRNAEAYTLWGAARHAHVDTDYGIVDGKGKLSQLVVPFACPEVDDAEDILDHGCPLAQAIIAVMFGGFNTRAGWDRALEVIGAGDGWKLVAAAFKST